MAGHYDVLGVAPSATAEEVRRAYLALARRYHPDAHAGAGPDVLDEARRRMQAVNEAWRVLGDPARRRAYDAEQRPASATSPDDAPWEGRRIDLADLLVPDPPPRPSTRADLVTLVPAAIGAVAALALVFSVMLASAPLLVAAFGGLVLAGITFVLIPFWVLARDRRR